jgi:hypothetical protein
MLAATSGTGGRFLLELGLILGILGALLVAVGAYVVLKGPGTSNRSFVRSIERSATLLGFLMIGVSLILQLAVQATRSLR